MKLLSLSYIYIPGINICYCYFIEKLPDMPSCPSFMFSSRRSVELLGMGRSGFRVVVIVPVTGLRSKY